MVWLVLFALLCGSREARAEAQECYDDGSEFCIDRDDILSVDLLPGSFLFMDQQYRANESRANSEAKAAGDNVTMDGSFGAAFDGMQFHR